VDGPFSFKIKNFKCSSSYQSGGTVTQVKTPQLLKLLPLFEAIENPGQYQKFNAFN